MNAPGLITFGIRGWLIFILGAFVVMLIAYACSRHYGGGKWRP